MRSSVFKHCLASALFVAASFAGALSSGPARADVAPADPIDTTMRGCLARADRSSTAGQVQCVDEASALWQRAIDTAYQSLLANAPSDKARHGWQASQRHWIAWREQETHLRRAVFATRHGTADAMSNADLQLQAVRDRALALRQVATQFAQAKHVPDAPAETRRLTPCAADAACAHADFDLNRYYRKLRERMPAHSRPLLVRAQRLWLAYRDATAPLIGASDRIDLIGARIATIKRLSEIVGRD